MKENYIKVCPRCGSTEITASTGRYALEAEVYRDSCTECGYEGLIPEVVESKLEEFRKKLK